MNDPHSVLGLPRSATPDEVRQRYLQLVREFPPEREPARFAEIRAAYEGARDPAVHWRNRLFTLANTETLGDIAKELEKRIDDARLPTGDLLSLAEQR